MGDDQAGYIASSEAFHGNVVSVYIKPASSPKNTLSGIDWTRVVLEDFGPLSSGHTGSIHQVVCADIDGDGVEEILVALMGSDPPTWKRTGVWCYKRMLSMDRNICTNPTFTLTAIDLEQGKFTKFKLSDDSAGRLDVGDFTGRGLVVSLLILSCVGAEIIYNVRTMQLSRTPCQDTSNHRIQP